MEVYKSKPGIVSIEVSDGDTTEPRFVAGLTVDQVIRCIEGVLYSAEASKGIKVEGKKARRPRRTKAQMEVDGYESRKKLAALKQSEDPKSETEEPQAPTKEKKEKAWA
jgi:hypothetical protein